MPYFDILFIGKYPPIQGGTTSHAYWLIKALGKRGNKIKVVTNAWEAEEKKRVNIDEEDIKYLKPKNVELFSTNPFDMPSHIPISTAYLEKLTSLSLEVMKKYNVDVIDTWYILPYVLAGFFNKTFTKKPLIARHAGSDITRLWEYGFFSALFTSVLKNVDKIVTFKNDAFLSRDIDISKLANIRYSIDTDEFNSNVKPVDLSLYNMDDSIPTITYMGKIENQKGIFDLINTASKLKSLDFNLLLITDGERRKELEKYISERGIQERTKITGFIPPWKVPLFLRASTCVVSAEYDFPVRAHNPVVPREVMACGVCSLISRDICLKMPYSNLENGLNSIIFNPKNSKEFEEKLKFVITKPEEAKKIGKESLKFSKQTENFDEYIKQNIKLYEEVVNNAQ